MYILNFFYIFICHFLRCFNYFYFNGICELFLVIIVSRILVYIYNIIKHLILYYASLYGSNPINKVYYRYFKFSISIIPYNTTKNIVAL